MKNKYLKTMAALGVAMVALLACKKPEKVQPSNTTTTVDNRPKVRVIKDIVLANQYLANAAGNHYLTLADSSTHNTDTKDFDICYYNFSTGSENRHVLGSPAASKTNDFYTNIKTTNKTIFYTVPTSFTYANYDTLKVSVGLKDFIDNQCIAYVSDIPTTEKAAIYSDKFGWGKNSVIAFKTQAGKYGMLKVTNSGTGSAFPTAVAGSIGFEVKVEK